MGSGSESSRCLTPLFRHSIITSNYLMEDHPMRHIEFQYFQKRSGIRKNSVTAPGILANSATKPSNLGTTEFAFLVALLALIALTSDTFAQRGGRGGGGCARGGFTSPGKPSRTGRTFAKTRRRRRSRRRHLAIGQGAAASPPRAEPRLITRGLPSAAVRPAASVAASMPAAFK